MFRPKRYKDSKHVKQFKDNISQQPPQGLSFVFSNQMEHPSNKILPGSPQEMDQLLLTFGDIPHHGPVLLAWVLLRHTLQPDDSSPVIRRIGNSALQLSVFSYISTMLKSLAFSGNDVRTQRYTLGWSRNVTSLSDNCCSEIIENLGQCNQEIQIAI